MKISRKQAVVAILAVAGVYMAAWHTPPLPFNHEAIGLPPFHAVHAIIGLILLAGAYFVWKKWK